MTECTDNSSNKMHQTNSPKQNDLLSKLHSQNGVDSVFKIVLFFFFCFVFCHWLFPALSSSLQKTKSSFKASSVDRKCSLDMIFIQL